MCLIHRVRNVRIKINTFPFLLEADCTQISVKKYDSEEDEHRWHSKKVKKKNFYK